MAPSNSARWCTVGSCSAERRGTFPGRSEAVESESEGRTLHLAGLKSSVRWGEQLK